MPKAVVLLNLGTPDDPHPRAVGRYLREFLMDPTVIDIPVVLRWILVNILIIPRRMFASSKAYRKIWKLDSPLRIFHKSLSARVADRLGSDYVVIPAMRYGKPSIAKAVERLTQIQPSQILFAPLYPQWSNAATGSSSVDWEKQLKKQNLKIPYQTLKPFYSDHDWIRLVAEKCKKTISEMNADHLLLSFHGLPKRQVTQANPTTCFVNDPACCEQGVEPWCYRKHCAQTARLISEKLSTPTTLSYQSRLGRTEWLKPFTDEIIQSLIQKGVKRLAVACPAFTTDCLETLEEVAIRLKESFIELGGENLVLVPCLNDDPEWAELLAAWIADPRGRFL